jgi:hypothetical protein
MRQSHMHDNTIKHGMPRRARPRMHPPYTQTYPLLCDLAGDDAAKRVRDDEDVLGLARAHDVVPYIQAMLDRIAAAPHGNLRPSHIHG